MNKDRFFSFSHFNIGSCGTGFDLFVEFVEQQSIDILGLSETWLNDYYSNESIRIRGYKIVRSDRGSRGGGVAFYIKENIKFRVLKIQIEFGLEQLWISIKIGGKNI